MNQSRIESDTIIAFGSEITGDNNKTRMLSRTPIPLGTKTANIPTKLEKVKANNVEKKLGDNSGNKDFI